MRWKLAGKTFGRLTIISFAFTKERKGYWLCRCSCGTEKYVQTSAIMNGTTVSCGCQKSDRMKLLNITRRPRKGKRPAKRKKQKINP